MPVHLLLVSLNVTCSRFVRTIERKCGIDPSVFVTRIACMDAERCGVYILWSDQDITKFLEDVAKEDDVPTLYVYDDSSMCSGDNVGGDANTEGDANVVETEEPQEEEDVEGDEEVEEEEEEEEKTHSPILIIMTENVVITPSQPIPYNRRGRVIAEQVFHLKPEMTLALGMKFLEEGFEFKTIRSSKHRYEEVCVHDNCGWRIYATSIGSSDMFQVRKSNDVHVCSRTQMHPAHRQATRRVLSHLLLDKIGDISKTIRGCDIVRDIKARYKIDISYWQAWRAKWRAICMIEELKNLGTVTDITTDVTERFASCFFALGWVGDYLGTMFLAVAMDANNQVVPIAIGVAKSESGESCTYFFPNAEKVYRGNGSVEFNKKIFWKTCKAYTTYKLDLNMSALRAAVPGAEFLDRVNPNRWPRAHFPEDRYRDAKVQYYNKSCSCNRWQLSGLPCGHAIAVAAMQNLTDCSHLVSPYFTIENLKATWAPVVYPIEPQLAWVSPDFPLMIVRPPIMNRTWKKE
ncbi:hypothetical protein OSB04_029376 [Centaurea solstitialis]|uniref:SWIM-type domain-containing protein n=1 Tax=Centaurea solstitialis TaxID=347529 RepID=A0AA38W8M2_9ASTR|nr:hypothetical protein OSB04_029376 [Centaurea solstitialis]